jgi:outer membrane receptor protein involved in Fe transport
MLRVAVMNLLDQSYRTHGSGMDAPGIDAQAGLHWRF